MLYQKIPQNSCSTNVSTKLTTRLSLLLCYYDFFVWFIMMLLHFFFVSLPVGFIHIYYYFCAVTQIFFVWPE